MKRLMFIISIVCLLFIAAEAQELKNGRPGYFPIPPKKENSLFFIQRNKNENTIVYDANMQSNGEFKKNKPIDTYWLRYTSTGYRKELGWLERTFAYGYSSKKDKNGNGRWIELAAYDERKIHLKKSTDDKPIATITCNGKECKLDYIYVFVDESSTWPRVIHVDIHGVEVDSGIPQVERILNK